MCRFRECMGKIRNVLIPSFSTVWFQYMLPNNATRFGFTASLKTEFGSVPLGYLDHAKELAWEGRNEHCYLACHFYFTCLLYSLAITPQLVHWQEKLPGIKSQWKNFFFWVCLQIIVFPANKINALESKNHNDIRKSTKKVLYDSIHAI